MSDVNENPLETQDSDLKMPTELELMKQKATLMSITFSNNIGLEALKQKIKDKEDSVNSALTGVVPTPAVADAPVNPLADPSAKVGRTPNLREYLHASQMKLVRLRITNMDPKKADLPGEILTFANDHLGTVARYIPFGEVTDNGWHVPYCIYEMLRTREFLQIRTVKRPGGRTEVKTQWVREFSLEVLPELNPSELARLAAVQAARGDLD